MTEAAFPLLEWKSTDTGIEVGEHGVHGWEWWTSIPYADWPKDILSEHDIEQFVVQYFMARWPVEMVAE